MGLDKHWMFDDASEHLTTEASTNLIDLSGARQMAGGQPLYFNIVVTTAFTDGSSNSTMAITLETDDADTFGSATTVQTVGTFAALSAVGTRFRVPLQFFTTPERFLRVKYTVANGDLSTGKFSSWLSTGVEETATYADGRTIS